MPRDKKIIHRSTSEVEDEVSADEEESLSDTVLEPDLVEERKKFLKEIILKRTRTIKLNKQQRFNLTKN